MTIFFEMLNFHNFLMSSFILCISFLVCLVQNASSKDEAGPRIVGGSPCDYRDYPYLVTILTGNSLCGGSILTGKWVLTAAHCIDKKLIKEYKCLVRTGFDTKDMNDVQSRMAIRGYPHQNFPQDDDYREYVDYESPDLRWDIGMLLVNTPFIEAKNVKFAPLPPPGFDGNCSTARAMGIGRTEVQPAKRSITMPKTVTSRPLLCVDLRIVTKEVCLQTWTGAIIDESIICTMEEVGGKDACQGDSGGPFVCEDVIIGVVSAGAGCGIAGNAAVFTKVESYLDWMNETMKNATTQLQDSGLQICLHVDFTHQVVVFGPKICMGTLLSYEFIITSAHCIDNEHISEGKTWIKTGFDDDHASDVQVIQAKKGMRHEKFKTGSIAYDIGIIELEKPLEETIHLIPAQLPFNGSTDSCTEPVGVGVNNTNMDQQYGNNSETALNDLLCGKVKLDPTQDKCRSLWPKSELNEHTICTTSEEERLELCKVFLHGPLTCKGVVIGLASLTHTNCSDTGKFAVYTKIETHMDFIQKFINLSIKRRSERINKAVDFRGPSFFGLCLATLIFVLM